MSTFHFCSTDSPPNSTFTDIQTLNKFNDEQFEELLGLVFSFLREPSKSNALLEQLDNFATEHGVSASGLRGVIKSAINIPNCGLRRNLSHTQIKEDFVNLGLSEEKAVSFAEKYNSNYLSLSKTALNQTLMVNQLVDMEWKFGVTAASSEINKVGNTFLQMKLTIDKGTTNENLYMELTLPQFYSFLHEMEKAKASLEMLS